jgi:hypothetical protein
MRWRSWFGMWRSVARYVCLREMLLYHVGFEALADADDSAVRYAPFETLLMDHSGASGKVSPSVKQAGPAVAALPKFTVPQYSGRGDLPNSIVQAAENVLAQHLKGESAMHPLSLSPSAVRALYALQLEMDSLLPIHICAVGRVWAEERVSNSFRMRFQYSSTHL